MRVDNCERIGTHLAGATRMQRALTGFTNEGLTLRLRPQCNARPMDRPHLLRERALFHDLLADPHPLTETFHIIGNRHIARIDDGGREWVAGAESEAAS